MHELHPRVRSCRQTVGTCYSTYPLSPSFSPRRTCTRRHSTSVLLKTVAIRCGTSSYFCCVVGTSVSSSRPLSSGYGERRTLLIPKCPIPTPPSQLCTLAGKPSSKLSQTSPYCTNGFIPPTQAAAPSPISSVPSHSTLYPAGPP